jgi:hypothetical protein
MGYTINLNHPHFPKGTPFSVTGLGEIENGGSIGLDEDAERFFVANTGLTVEEAFTNDASIKLSGSSELTDDDIKQLIPADRGTREELGQTGGQTTEVEETVPPVQKTEEKPAVVVASAEGGEE